MPSARPAATIGYRLSPATLPTTQPMKLTKSTFPRKGMGVAITSSSAIATTTTRRGPTTASSACNKPATPCVRRVAARPIGQWAAMWRSARASSLLATASAETLSTPGANTTSSSTNSPSVARRLLPTNLMPGSSTMHPRAMSGVADTSIICTRASTSHAVSVIVCCRSSTSWRSTSASSPSSASGSSQASPAVGSCSEQPSLHS